MASIPCAAYQATTIHCHLRRQRFTQSQSVGSTETGSTSAPSSPAPQSADAARGQHNFFGQLSEKMSRMWTSQDQKRPALEKSMSVDSGSSN